MPFIKRDENGLITAVSQNQEVGWEKVASDDPALSQFLLAAGGDALQLTATDLGFVRVLEDVVELLIDKRLILFTELPASAQEKMLHRQLLRSELGVDMNLIGDD